MNKSDYRWFKIFEDYASVIEHYPENRINTYQVDGYSVCVVKLKSQLYAFRNKCPHNGVPLHHAECTEEVGVVCPMHRYHFSLVNGKALSGSGNLEIYPISHDETGVYIGFEIKKSKWW